MPTKNSAGTGTGEGRGGAVIKPKKLVVNKETVAAMAGGPDKCTKVGSGQDSCNYSCGCSPTTDPEK